MQRPETTGSTYLTMAVLVVLSLFSAPEPTAAQARDPEIGAYTLVSDFLAPAALFVNPASVGFHRNRTAVLAQATWDRPEDADWQLGQYLLGLQANVLGLGYRHDEFVSGAFSQGDAYTVALGYSMANSSVGVSRTWRTVGEADGSWVIGAGYTTENAAIGVVWRDLGGPRVREVTLTERLIGGVHFRPPGGTVTVASELDYSLDGGGVRLVRVGGGVTFAGSVRVQGLLGWDGDGDFDGFVISAHARLGAGGANGLAAARLDAGGDAGSVTAGVDLRRQNRGRAPPRRGGR